MRVPEDAEMDFAAGCLVVEDGEILLMNHSKLGKWLQPGGHVEDDETPDETAKRETFEETGVKVEFLETPKFEAPDSENLPKPFNINLHNISEDHMHCSFLYLTKPKEKKEATHSHEHNGQKWFSKEELKQLDNIPGNLRKAALEAIKQQNQNPS